MGTFAAEIATTVQSRSEGPNQDVRVTRFLAIACQLALILLAVYLLRIERQLPLFQVLCLAAAGFLVHSWLPSQYRLPFFGLLSVGAILALLGWPDSAWVLGLGGVLIALCHLPIPAWHRALLLLCGAMVLVFWRIDSDEAFWPVLASMFMFRIIFFLYDTRHKRDRPSVWQSLAYFFMLPNLCFPFFPIVDFRTFRETHYEEDAGSIYQTGIAWIVRGLVHLLAARFVKFYLLPAPHEVTDLPHLVLFMAALYAMYLRFSGWFH